MDYCAKIKARRIEMNLTQRDMANYLEITQQAYAMYETGKRKISFETALKIGEKLEISLDELGLDFRSTERYDDFTLGIYEQSMIKKYRTLDRHGKEMVDVVLEKEYNRCYDIAENSKKKYIHLKYIDVPVSAGLGEMLNDYDYWETVKVPLTPESRKADFVLRINGDSMEPTFSDGEFILVRQQPAVDVGQIGIFLHNGNGYIKKYGGNKLISLNSGYRDIILNEESRCFGLVLGTTVIEGYDSFSDDEYYYRHHDDLSR